VSVFVSVEFATERTDTGRERRKKSVGEMMSMVVTKERIRLHKTRVTTQSHACDNSILVDVSYIKENIDCSSMYVTRPVVLVLGSAFAKKIFTGGGSSAQTRRYPGVTCPFRIIFLHLRSLQRSSPACTHVIHRLPTEVIPGAVTISSTFSRRRRPWLESSLVS